MFCSTRIPLTVYFPSSLSFFCGWSEKDGWRWDLFLDGRGALVSRSLCWWLGVRRCRSCGDAVWKACVVCLNAVSRPSTVSRRRRPHILQWLLHTAIHNCGVKISCCLTLLPHATAFSMTVSSAMCIHLSSRLTPEPHPLTQSEASVPYPALLGSVNIHSVGTSVRLLCFHLP